MADIDATREYLAVVQQRHYRMEPAGGPLPYCHFCQSALTTLGWPCDAAKQVAALAAVLALHTERSEDDSAGHLTWCATCEETYPCPTIAAIDAALLAEETRTDA